MMDKVSYYGTLLQQAEFWREVAVSAADEEKARAWDAVAKVWSECYSKALDEEDLGEQ